MPERCSCRKPLTWNLIKMLIIAKFSAARDVTFYATNSYRAISNVSITRILCIDKSFNLIQGKKRWYPAWKSRCMCRSNDTYVVSSRRHDTMRLRVGAFLIVRYVSMLSAHALCASMHLCIALYVPTTRMNTGWPIRFRGCRE